MTPSELARKAIELRDKATQGEWSELDEPCEIHSVELADGSGDPLHICERVNNQSNTDFIVHAANHIKTIAEYALRLERALEECERQRDYWAQYAGEYLKEKHLPRDMREIDAILEGK